ncbi:MAG TPA: recombinase family protein [Pseudonocardiaceae bacterium]
MTRRRIGIYVRISRDRVGAGLGVERQERDCRDLASSIGGDVIDVYVDNDLSASTGKPRPEYERLLRDIESGHINSVVAWHSDRLHRRPDELERYIQVCDPLAVPTRTVKAGELDLSTASGRMVARIIGAVARHETEQKSERLRRQRAQGRAAGRWHGGRRPFGYLADGVTPEPEEKAAVAKATELVLGGASLRSIARAWNEEGLTTTAGGQWTHIGLRAMLLRPRNAGLIGNLSGTSGPAVWEPLVDVETWHALCAHLRDVGRRSYDASGQGRQRKLLGSFLFRCGMPACGEYLMSGGHGARGQTRYRCRNHGRRASDPVDEYVRLVIAGALNRYGADLLPVEDDMAAEHKLLGRLKARSEELAVGWAELGMTDSQFRTANETLTTKIAALEGTLARAAGSSAVRRLLGHADPGAVFLAAGDPKSGVPGGVDFQRAIIAAVCSVYIKSAPRGRKGFDSDLIEIRWHHQPPEA